MMNFKSRLKQEFLKKKNLTHKENIDAAIAHSKLLVNKIDLIKCLVLFNKLYI